MPRCAAASRTPPPQQLVQQLSTPSPTHSAGANAVASAMTIGTSTNSASVFARSVFSTPSARKRMLTLQSNRVELRRAAPNPKNQTATVNEDVRSTRSSRAVDAAAVF